MYCCAIVQVGTDPDLWEEAVDSLLDEGVPFVLTAFDELDQATDVGFLQVRVVRGCTSGGLPLGLYQWWSLQN